MKMSEKSPGFKKLWFMFLNLLYSEYCVKLFYYEGHSESVAFIFVSLHLKKLSKWNTALIVTQIVCFVCVPHPAM